MKTIDRYIFKELTMPFFQSLSVLTFLLLLNKVMSTADLVINQGLELAGVFKLLTFILPPFLAFTIPISVLIATIISFARMSEDSEIIVLRSAGLSITRLMLPVITFALLATSVTYLFSSNHKPWSERSIKNLGWELLKNEQSLVILEENTFNQLGKKIMVFVEKAPTYSDLEKIFISDSRNPDRLMIITAKKAAVITDAQEGIFGFRLTNGTIHTSTSPEKSEQILFKQYDLKININDIFSIKNKKTQISVEQASALLEQGKGDKTKLLKIVQNNYKNYFYPFSALAFALVGVPLGIVNKRAGKSGGFAIGIIFVVVFYLLNIVADNIVSRQILTPLTGATFPVLTLSTIGVYMIWSKERST